MSEAVVLEDVSVVYRRRRRSAGTRAVDGVSLRVARGRTLGLVGESGSGKSSLGRCILRLEPAASGTVRVFGADLGTLRRHELRAARRRMQMVFQDPKGSLDPRMSVVDNIGELLRAHDLQRTRAGVRRRVGELLETVGLDAELADRYPHELSGGQGQRVAIARALAIEAELLVCDEPTSALDVSVQAQVIKLLRRLQREFDLTYVFISHDLAVVRQMADEVAVMYAGRVVEVGPRDSIFATPRHPYTMSLLSSVPAPDPIAERKRERVPLSGETPDLASLPPGCPFNPRCPFSAERCQAERPVLETAAEQHGVACHRWDAILRERTHHA